MERKGKIDEFWNQQKYPSSLLKKKKKDFLFYKAIFVYIHIFVACPFYLHQVKFNNL